MSAKKQLAEFTIQIQTNEMGSNDISLRDFTDVLNSIVNIHDALAMLIYPDTENSPVLNLACISMNSLPWLKLISFKDIVEAIAELLKIPKELKHESLENEKLIREIESLTQEIDSKKQKKYINREEYSRQMRLLDEKIRQEQIKTLSLGHESIAKVVTSLADVAHVHPVLGRQLEPITLQIAKEIYVISQSPLYLEVTDIRIWDIKEEERLLHSGESMNKTDEGII